MRLTVDNLNKQAYDELKRGILSKELPAGMRLVDSKLAEQYGISRTPIRDALMKLSEEGLVYSNGRGFSVYQPTANDIREVFELRLLLDLFAVRKLIAEILPRDPDAEARIDETREREFSNGESTFIKNDEDFHDCIIALVGNARLAEFYADLRDQTRAFRSITSRDAERRKKAHTYHDRIYRAIKARDIEAAEEAIERHVMLSMEDALRDFEK